MDTTPEIEATLASLTQLCCDGFDGNKPLDLDRVDALTKNLSTNGWERHSSGSAPLSTILKTRVKSACQEPAMHRGAELDGMVAKIQAAYRKASRMEASSPGDENQQQPMPPRTTA